MHRQNLLDLLQTYSPQDSQDELIKNNFIHFVRENPLCFERSLTKGHVTGSTWLLHPTEDKVLLHFHKKLQKWMQCGGHADGDPIILNVAVREAEEESGISGVYPVENGIFDIDVHLIPKRDHEPEHLHYDARFLLRAPHENFLCSAESEKLQWFTFEELKRLNVEESVLRMARKWFMGKGNES
ncbi:MAG TPA: NUDIX hydrolase [Deltaproteobacteria bacterium]|nr:MAG: hypothetical protein A2048_01925 [Deltaproteobacteria bacterium GWA2_45_12]HBF13886.1 NUDIX hydrolase [Deltaproteobacteria bacterium]